MLLNCVTLKILIYSCECLSVVFVLIFAWHVEFVPKIALAMCHKVYKIMTNYFHFSPTYYFKIFNILPWIGPFLKSRRTLHLNGEENKKQIRELVSGLQETLNPEERRGFVDSFLLRKQSDEVGNGQIE